MNLPLQMVFDAGLDVVDLQTMVGVEKRESATPMSLNGWLCHFSRVPSAPMVGDRHLFSTSGSRIGEPDAPFYTKGAPQTPLYPVCPD